jgi:hypothetical protein
LREASRARTPFTPALLGSLLDDPYDAVRYIAARSLRANGVDPDAMHYDFVQRPSQRQPFAQRAVARMLSDLSAAERTNLQQLFDRLQRERDDKPVRLLE